MISPNARRVTTSGLPAGFRVNCRCCGSHPGGGPSDEGGLLREDEDGRASQRLRPSCAEVESREGVLRRLRVLPGHSRESHPASLSALRRRIFCHCRHSRARPLAPSTCSSTARLIRLRRWLVPQLRDEEKETQQEDSMKYLLMIVAAMALVGTANATSRSADCCGGPCCLVKSSCCAK